jgi:Tfp pilus assembly protein PilO
MNRLILTIVCFAVALSLGFGVLLPKYQRFELSQTGIEKKDIELQYKEEKISQLRTISGELKENQESLSKILTALPTTPSVPSLFNFLQRTSSETGLVLESIDLSGIVPLEESSELKAIQIKLQVVGSYSAFKDFLSALENSARIFEVKSISFSAPREGGKSFSFSLSIIAHSY